MLAAITDSPPWQWLALAASTVARCIALLLFAACAEQTTSSAVPGDVPGEAAAGYPDDWPELGGRGRANLNAVVEEAEATRQTEIILKKPISVEFANTPLIEVIDFMRNKKDLNFFVNWPQLKTIGVDPQQKITMQFTNVPGDQAFRQVLLRVQAQVNAPRANTPSYQILDGIVNITTALDLVRTTDIRIYDVRDLLVEIPNNDANWPEPKIDNPRLQAVADILILIRTNVGFPEHWEANGGEVSSVRELNGNLVVRTTPEFHGEIVKLIKLLRRSRGVQVRIESYVLLLDDKTYQKARRLFDLDRGFDRNDDPRIVETQYLSGENSVGLRNLVKRSDDSRIAAAPRVLLHNGQRGHIQIAEETAYVSGVKERVIEGETRFEPVVKTFNTGITLTFEADVHAGREHVTTYCRPEVSSLLEMKREAFAPAKGDPPDDLFIETPVFSKWTAATTLLIPNDSVFMIVGREVEMKTDDDAPLTNKQRVIILVKPTIIIPPNDPDKKAGDAKDAPPGR